MSSPPSQHPVTAHTISPTHLNLLRQIIERLDDAEETRDNVHGSVALSPHFVQALHGLVHVALVARDQRCAQQDGVRLIADLIVCELVSVLHTERRKREGDTGRTHLEDVVWRDHAETGPC